MTRDTTTGTNYETEVENLLEDYSEHTVESQVMVGTKRNGGKHYCDIVLNEDELISLKYQRVQGTAEEKIPFEFMKLQHAIDDYGYKSATIVVAGPDKAWKWKDYYLSDEFRGKMSSIYPNVRIINHEQFVSEYLYQ
jgi:hypothetical protein|tara:strand:+ start:487 stop:897 length:411 start_codon:yes stop_codon:yes gene_type:complete